MSDIIGSLSAYDNNSQKENENNSQSDTAKALIKKDEYGKKKGRMSNEEILKKLLVYKNSYVDFIEDFGRIRAHGLKKFKLFDYQKDLIKNFQENKFNLILKARQTGISTTTGAYLGTYGIFNPHEDIIIAAINEEVAKELILKIKTFYENLPTVVRPKILNPRNKETIELANGTRFIALTSTSNTGRSFNASFLVLDEAAFVRDVSTMWSGAYPSLSLGGRAIILSTPDQENSWFHKMCIDAENKENEFKLTKIYWFNRPEYNNEKWKRTTVANMCHGDISIFEREYECVSPDTLIYTKDGAKEIKDIQIGEYVLTHKGRFRKVTSVMSRTSKKNENIYKIDRINYNTYKSLIISGKHPLEVCEFSKMNNFNEQIKKNEYEIKFKNLDDLFNDKKIWLGNLFPELDKTELFNGEISKINLNENDEFLEINNKLRYANSNSKNNIDKYIKLDYNLGKVIGLYVAEGSQSYLGKTVDFGINANEEELKNIVVNYFKSIGMEKDVNFLTYENSNRARFTIRNRIISKLINIFIYDKNSESDETFYCMKWFNDIIYNCPPEFIKGIIIGHYLGDGLHDVGCKISSGSVSEKLIYQLRLMYNYFGFYPAINKCDNRCFCLEITNTFCNIEKMLEHDHADYLKRGSRIKIIDNKVFTLLNDYYRKDNNIEKIDYTGELYNLSVDEDESYIANNIVVHNCSFHSSSQTVIPIKTLNELIRKNVTNKVQKVTNFITKKSKKYDNLDIYELPKENAIYLISCDTAEGLGKDRDASAFLLFNITDNKVIGEYADKEIKEKNLAEMLDDIGRTYNDALIVIEMRSTGQLVAQYLLDTKGLNYPNIFWSDRRSGLFLDETTPMKIIGKYSVKDKNAIPGFYTTSKNKSILVPEMKNTVIDNEVEILTNGLLEQLKSYIAVNGKYKAEGTNNDDIVSSFFIGLYIKKMYWKLIENNNLLTDEIIKYFTRDIMKATDNREMADILRFAPVWKTGKHQTLYDPYNSNKMLGDLRCFLDEKK